MKIPRDISAEELIAALAKLGYNITRQKGSHIRLTVKTEERIHHLTIPNHNPLKIGTLNNILNALSNFHKIEKKDLIKKLFE
ncbi:MAG: type II toxin-antitoxin system HicA family toxin [Melioribacteraceae bacterium]